MTCTATDGAAWKLSIHDALFAGVRLPSSNRNGTAWWALPATLLQMPVDGTAGRVHLFAVIAGQLFRTRMQRGRSEDACIGMERLVVRLGLKPRYLRDPRVAATVVRTLDAAVHAGVMSSWTEKRGKVGNGTALLRLEPGPYAIEVVGSRRLDVPERIPATGSCLVEWLNRAGLGMKEAANLLGISVRTLERAVKLYERPLPYGVRRSVRIPLPIMRNIVVNSQGPVIGPGFPVIVTGREAIAGFSSKTGPVLGPYDKKGGRLV